MENGPATPPVRQYFRAASAAPAASDTPVLAHCWFRTFPTTASTRRTPPVVRAAQKCGSAHRPPVERTAPPPRMFALRNARDGRADGGGGAAGAAAGAAVHGWLLLFV